MKERNKTFPPFIQSHLLDIRKLCQLHKVKNLWLFGSVLRKDFSLKSDIDFLYEMDDEQIKADEWYFSFWGFLDSLTKLLDRKIDLVWYKGIKNPYFKEEVDNSKVLLYDVKGEKIPL
ncbi:MAG: nucleotidyltransferase domain-containing protein [Bacteroidota bacterium]